MIKKDYKMCPITKFVAWLILGLIVCIIGISNVFADTYSYNQFTAQLYDNYGPTLSTVTTDQTNGRWQGIIPTMTANSAGAAWGVSSNMVLLANHTYTLTAQITGTYGGRLVLSTYNRIGVGTTLANAKTSYQNNSYVNENYSRVLDDGYTIQFAFTPTTNGSYIVFPFATNYTGSNQYFYLTNYTIDDLGSSGGVSESTINNSLNSQTNVLNQSITNSQNAIIQNQNENNQALQDTINDNFQSCENRNLISNFFNYNVLSNYFTITNRSSDILFQAPSNVPSGVFTIGYSVNLEKDKTYTLHSEFINNRNLTFNWYVYQTNWSSGLLTYGMDSNGNLSITPTRTGTHYIQLYSMTAMSTGWDWALTKFEININECTNKLDETNNNLSNIFNNLTDDSSATFDSSMINLIPNAPITNLLTIPISLLQSILTRANNSCTPISIPFLFNHNLTFPCFTISDYLGSATNIIDLCICFVMIYNIIMLFISVFEDITTLRDGFLGLYEPQHAPGSYKPRHGKG